MTHDTNDHTRRIVRKIMERHKEPRPIDLGRAVPAPGGGWVTLMHRHVSLDSMVRKIAREKRLRQLRQALASWRRRKQTGGAER